MSPSLSKFNFQQPDKLMDFKDYQSPGPLSTIIETTLWSQKMLSKEDLS